MKYDPTDCLCAMYEDYCVAHDLPLVSADEQDIYHLPPKQRAWIHSFITIWDSFHA